MIEYCALFGTVEREELFETITLGNDFLALLLPSESGWVRVDEERLRRKLSVSESISIGTQIFRTFVSIKKLRTSSRNYVFSLNVVR